jgi:hypothetical protein
MAYAVRVGTFITVACCLVAAVLWRLPMSVGTTEQSLHVQCLSGDGCAEKAKILRLIDGLASKLEKRSAPLQSSGASPSFDEQYATPTGSDHYTLHLPSPPGAESPPPPMHFRIRVPDGAPAAPYRVHFVNPRAAPAPVHVIYVSPSHKAPASDHVIHVHLPSPASTSPGSTSRNVVHVHASPTQPYGPLTLHVHYHGGGVRQHSPITVPVPSETDSQPLTVEVIQSTRAPEQAENQGTSMPSHGGLPRFPPVEVFTRTPIDRTDCEVGKWSEWSECSATCGRGLKMKRRRIVKAAANGGQPCPALQRSDYCNTDPCPCVRQTTSGEFCVFPFFWNGRNQWDCVEYDATLRMWWCPTVKEFKDPFPGHQTVENDFPAKPSFPGLPHKEWDWCEAGCAQLNATEVAELTKRGISMTNFAP